MGIKWPRHDITLCLTHNGHKTYYSTVLKSIKEDDFGYGEDCWVNEEQKQKAIDTNECWVIQWYPNTPVGFCVKSAADLDVLLDAVKNE